MLSEHEMVSLIQCAARRDEDEAKACGPEFYKEYKDLVAQMEKDKKNGLKCTYSIPNSYE